MNIPLKCWHYYLFVFLDRVGPRVQRGYRDAAAPHPQAGCSEQHALQKNSHWRRAQVRIFYCGPVAINPKFPHILMSRLFVLNMKMGLINEKPSGSNSTCRGTGCVHPLLPKILLIVLIRPEKKGSINSDFVFRRFYVLDADVEEHSFELFVIDPKGKRALQLVLNIPVIVV